MHWKLGHQRGSVGFLHMPFLLALPSEQYHMMLVILKKQAGEADKEVLGAKVMILQMAVRLQSYIEKMFEGREGKPFTQKKKYFMQEYSLRWEQV